MAIDYRVCKELLESGWMVDLAADDDDVPDDLIFSYVLKEGAPKDIREKFDDWKDAFEWERDHLEAYRIAGENWRKRQGT
jgi:hypothetical protein